MKYSTIKYYNETTIERLLGFNNYIKAYVFLFFVFSLQIVPNDIIIAMSIIVFAAANLETEVYLYFFSLPWMYVGKFSFGLTISLINTILLVLKIAIARKRLRFSYLELFILAYLAIIGTAALVLYGTFTGISIVLYFFVAIYIYYAYAADVKECDEFWCNCLLIIMVSTLIGIIYGFRADTGFDRWIRGMGYVTQLYGTMGTTRFGLYLLLSMLYPLYYVREKIPKIILCVLFSIAILATVSMTALLLLTLVLVYYVLSTGKLSVRKIGTIIVAFVAVILIIVYWDRIGNIDIFKPIYTRANLVINQLRLGDINSAMSGRVSMSEVYTDRFKSYDYFNKLVGGATISVEESGYSHNSYLDMLNYCGILGGVLLLFLQLQHIRGYIHTQVRNQAILVKLLFIITAATVSIFSSQYWLLFFFM